MALLDLSLETLYFGLFNNIFAEQLDLPATLIRGVRVLIP